MTWYQFVVYIHVMGAIVWVGGIFFLALIAVPAVRRLTPTNRTELMSEFGHRFLRVGYATLAIVIVTGLIQAAAHGATVANVWDGSFFQGRFGTTLGVKVLFVIAMIGVSITHDFFIGPASVRAAQAGKDMQRLRKTASWLARLTALLALVVVAYAVMLVR